MIFQHNDVFIGVSTYTYLPTPIPKHELILSVSNIIEQNYVIPPKKVGFLQ